MLRGDRLLVWALTLALVLMAAATSTSATVARAAPPTYPPPGPHVIASHVDLAASEREGGHTRPLALPAMATGTAAAGEANRAEAGLAAPAQTITAAPTSRGMPVAASHFQQSYSSPNWAGYVAGPGPFTAASGTFSVPNLAATPTTSVTSEWVGIDGVQPNPTLIQAGVTETYDPGTNLVSTYAWWEILPDDPINIVIPWSQLSVLPGHSVSVAIWQVGGTLWALSVSDNTTGQTFTTQQVYAGTLATADWIVEAPTDEPSGTIDTLGDFSPPVTFTDARVTGTQTTLDAWVMTQGGVEVAAPSALVSDSFSVSYTGTVPVTAPTPPPTPVPTPLPAPTVYRVTAGQSFNLTLTGATPGLTAQWQISPNETNWSVLANVIFDAAGGSTYTFTPTQTAYYQTWYPTLGRYGDWIIEVIVQGTSTASPSPSATPSPTPTPSPGSPVPTIFTVTAGEPVTIDQQGPPNTLFTLQVSPDDVSWTALAQLTTDAAGNASYTFTPSATAYYRSLFPAGPTPLGYGIVLPGASASIQISGPAVITWGSTATYTVTMAGGANRVIEVQATRDSINWSTVVTVTIDANGSASFSYRPATNLYYRAVFAGAAGVPGASSETIRTVVRQIALPRGSTAPRVIGGGTTVAFATVVRPDRTDLPAPRATFRVYHWTGTSWALYHAVVVTADAYGVASMRWTFATRGLWYVRSMANPTPYNANSVWSTPQRFSVS